MHSFENNWKCIVDPPNYIHLTLIRCGSLAWPVWQTRLCIIILYCLCFNFGSNNNIVYFPSKNIPNLVRTSRPTDSARQQPILIIFGRNVTENKQPKGRYLPYPVSASKPKIGPSRIFLNRHWCQQFFAPQHGAGRTHQSLTGKRKSSGDGERWRPRWIAGEVLDGPVDVRPQRIVDARRIVHRWRHMIRKVAFVGSMITQKKRSSSRIHLQTHVYETLKEKKLDARQNLSAVHPLISSPPVTYC